MARQKHVFKTEMVNHVWAQQSQDSGRNASQNVSFEGTTLFSYSTPVANFVTNKKGKKACLITTCHYSVTTSQNMPSARDIPPGIPVFRVKHLGVTGGRAPYPRNDGHEDFHKANLVVMAKKYNEGLARFARSRDYHPDHYFMPEKDSDIEQAKEYCKFFGVRFTPAQFPPATKELLDKLLAQSKKEAQAKAKATRAEKKRRNEQCERELKNYIELDADLDWDWKRYASEEQKARRLEFDFNKAKASGWDKDLLPDGWQAFATEEDKHAIAEKQLQEYFNAPETDNYKGARNSLGWQWSEIATEEQKERYETTRRDTAQASITAFLDGRGELVQYYKEYATDDQRAAIAAIDLQNWRSGVTARPVYSHSETLLRIKGDNIETSRGAEFPVTHAKRAWPVIKACKERGESWQRNGHTVHLGHFQIDSVDTRGNVRAGCHTVQYEEVERLARELELA